MSDRAQFDGMRIHHDEHRRLTQNHDYRSWRDCDTCLAIAVVDELKLALAKIDTIRNSIIGCQNVNWSAHIYPLVAALKEVGIDGMTYEDAAAKFAGADPSGAIRDALAALK